MIKPWYASTTIWGAVAAIVGGVYQLFGVDVDTGHFAATLAEVATVIGGLVGVIGRSKPDIQPLRGSK